MQKHLSGASWLPFSTIAVAYGTLAHLILSVLPRLKALLLESPTTEAYGLSKMEIVRSLLGVLQPVDFLIGGALILSVILSVAAEVQSRTWSDWLLSLNEKHSRWCMTVIVVSAFPLLAYLSPGVWTLGDSPQHITRVSLVTEMVGDGTLSRWTFSQYGGTTLLRFYGPLFFWVSGFLSSMLGSPHLAAKLVLGICHLASGLAVASWLRRRGFAGCASVLAALVYTWSFLHLHAILWAGALPLGVVYLLFPLLLERSDALMEAPSAIRSSGFALILALLLITHQGYAALCLQVWAFWILVSSLMRTDRMTLRTWGWLLASVVLGFGLASFFLLPAIVLADWGFLGDRPPILLPGLPSMSLLRGLLVWNNTWSGWSAAYLGLSAVVIACGGVVTILRARRGLDLRRVTPPLLLIVWVLLCTATTERVIHLVLPFLALLIAISFQSFGHRGRLGILALVILAADLGPTLVQGTFRTDLDRRDRMLGELSEASYPHRMLVGFNDGHEKSMLVWPNSGSPVLRTPSGGFPQGAPRAHLSAIALLDALNSPAIDPKRTSNLVILWDVVGLLLLNLDSPQDPVELTAERSPAPALFSRELRSVQRPGMEWDLQSSPQMLPEDDPRRQRMMEATLVLSEEMRIDRERLVVDALFTRSNEPVAEVWRDAKAEDTDATSVAFLDISMDVGVSHARVGFSTDYGGWIRLPFSYSQFLDVTVDETSVEVTEGAFGGIIVRTEPGVHEILIKPRVLKIDRIAVGMTLLAGLSMALVLVFSRAKTRRRADA